MGYQISENNKNKRNGDHITFIYIYISHIPTTTRKAVSSQTYNLFFHLDYHIIPIFIYYTSNTLDFRMSVSRTCTTQILNCMQIVYLDELFIFMFYNAVSTILNF